MTIDWAKWLITSEPPRYNGVYCGACNGPVQRHVHVDPNEKAELWACACGATASLHLAEGKLEIA